MLGVVAAQMAMASLRLIYMDTLANNIVPSGQMCPLRWLSLLCVQEPIPPFRTLQSPNPKLRITLRYLFPSLMKNAEKSSGVQSKARTPCLYVGRWSLQSLTHYKIIYDVITSIDRNL